MTQVGAKTLTHDAKGNITAIGTKAFGYSSENLLITGPNATTLSYDPVMRLHQTVSGPTTSRLAYDGLDRIAEYDGSNNLQRRYIHGPAMDEPIVWYEGSGTSDRRFLSADERGSIVSVTDSSGVVLGLNRYDEFGQPQATNLGKFGYTGQAWLPEIGVWYYKARAYDSELGRFLQTDPIGYEGGVNLYAYVGNDPVNLVDPLGLFSRGETLNWRTSKVFGGVTGFGSPRSGASAASACPAGVICVNGTHLSNGSYQDVLAAVATGDARGRGERLNANQTPQNGDGGEIVVTGYWKRQKAAGNPIAGRGLEFCYNCPADWSTGFARSSLAGAIGHRPINGRYPNAAQVRAIYGRIRLALMYADIAARNADHSGVPGLLSAGQIYDYHAAVFSRFGLSSSTFGGSYLTGSRSEAIAYFWYWCAACDR